MIIKDAFLTLFSRLELELLDPLTDITTPEVSESEDDDMVVGIGIGVANHGTPAPVNLIVIKNSSAQDRHYREEKHPIDNGAVAKISEADF